MATNIDKYIEASEIGSVAVPLGGIIGWMNPAAASMNPSPPAGFEFCDGTAVTTSGSPFLGQIKPNLMITSAGGAKGVARGANVTAAPYGVGTALITGGNDLHTHSSNTAGDHTHGMKSHTHTMSNHTHTVPSGGSHDHGGFTDPANQAGVPATGAVYQGGAFYHNHAIPSAGSTHAHPDTGTNNLPTAGPNDNATDNAGTHSHSLNNNTILPVFHTEVAQIMRVL